MSITKTQVAALVDELHERLTSNAIQSIQALGKRTFVFHIGKNDLLISLQEPFLRFHLLSHKKNTSETPFCKELMAFIKGERLTAFSQLNDDRILCLQLPKFKLLIEFFPKRPNLFLLDAEDQILLSLNPVLESHYQLPPKPTISSSEPALSSKELERLYQEKESAAEFNQAKQLLEQRLKQKIKRLKKSQAHCEQELTRGLAWEQAQHEAELLQAHFYRLKRGMQEITLEDWAKENAPCTLVLDPRLEPKEEAARRFKKAKKLRLSIEPLQKQLQAIAKQIATAENELIVASKATLLSEISSFEEQTPRARTEEKKALPYREFIAESGLKIWVGKNAKSNEKVTFSLSRGSDWWLHVHNYPGAHVVLRTGKLEPDPEALKDAVQVALAYSTAKDKGEAEICVTQVKYLSRMKKAGQVQVSKCKIMHARFDAERFKKIKERG